MKKTAKAITLILLLAISVLWAPAASHAAPNMVNYQGSLTDSGGTPVPDANYDMIFRVYDAATAGILLWEEGQTVATVNGVYNVLLGSVAANIGSFDPDLFSSDNRWLEVEVSDEILTPRQQVTSVAFALQAEEAVHAVTADVAGLAKDADTVDGFEAAALEESAEIDTDILSHAGDASAHHAKTTRFTDLTDQAVDAQLPAAIARDAEIMPTVLAGDGTGSTLDADFLDGLNSSAFMSSGADNWVDTSGDTMTGTLNLPANGLVAGTDQLVLSGGNVGIGTSSPLYSLDVRGGASGAVGYFFNTNTVSGSGSAFGISSRGNAYNTGTGYGYGGDFTGWGGSTSGNAIGTRNFAYAYGSSDAFGVYSYATLGTTTGREYAFFGWGDGFFSGDVGIGTITPGSKLAISGGATVGSAYAANSLSDGNLAISGNVGIGTTTPNYNLDVRGGVNEYLGSFNNNNNSSGNAYGLYARGSAYGTGTYDGYGATFLGQGGSTNGTAYGTQNLAYAYGTSNAIGVYSDATGGPTTGNEYAFYGIGDGYFSGNVGIGTLTPNYALEVQGGVNNYLGWFYNDNNSSGNAYGIYAKGDAYDVLLGTGTAIGGGFSGAGRSTGGDAYGTQNFAYAYGTSTAYGVYSNATAGTTTGNEWAFYGLGDAFFSGTLSKGAGAFKIDHPLDPENKYLYHSFVESPDMKNVYDGVVILDGNGEATVTMPDWFGALNRDFRYQLTCIGGFAPVYIAEEISGNTFKIAGGQPRMKISWQVTGIRQDAFANANRIPVEENKQGVEQGTYLHPEAHGLSDKRSLAWAQDPEMQKMKEERETFVEN